ncbi:MULTISPECIES: MalY/PatB family protein [unclassified Treponema]|uniref:MalY/PatB family protein n=1 Tax=unclassified Treponema TaxID=2638727 RepID=UPI0020A39306|nr:MULTISPECIES: MalY/PatB family protein [unclassified Treponema]UTC66108.1 pyridoxal phosphate-dependent aminotransferase [Treponema sp. OMZ 789]UTC68837.1 pyridoxal phosphate-dependent aminotransferase [Treponema sp. OMZ 790]UTC71565.1 pyridoxal phosphate-dependent aminotransferase [Treponema sp. OMZ 791]
MYDFVNTLSRKKIGAAKWELMYKWNPNVSEGVIPLSVADMEFKNPPEIIEGLKSYLDRLILGYSMRYADYDNAVINWLKRKHDYSVSPEMIMQTPGVVNAFFAAVNTFTEKGDGVIVMRPVYYPFSMAIEMNERELVNCPLLCDKDNYYTIDYDKFESLAKQPKNKLLIFCSPHNPVGRVWKKEELKRLAEIALENNVIVFSDEIWNDLIMPGYNHTLMASISKEIGANTITATAPSKTFNVAGLATSNIIVENENLRTKYYETLQKMRSSSVNALGLKACEIAYTRCDKWLDELLLVLDTNQKLVKNYFDSNFPMLKSRYIEGTYLQWIDFRALGMDNKALEDFMHNEAQFFTDEGYIFGSEGDGFERINIACPTKILEQHLEMLGGALKKKGF